VAKTIRQIADELGVSKTAVSKQIANLGLQSSLRKIGNQFAIDNQQEALIIQAFSGKSQTENANLVCDRKLKETDVNEAVIELLREELNQKNEQIQQLNERLAETTAALVAAQQTIQAVQQTTQTAQALHAGTIQQQLTGQATPELTVDDNNQKPLTFWQRIFGKQQ